MQLEYPYTYHLSNHIITPMYPIIINMLYITLLSSLRKTVLMFLNHHQYN